MLKIKRGDTFAFYADIKDNDGSPLVTNIGNIRSQIRDTSYQLVTELKVTATGTNGRYLFKADSTDTWPNYTWGENTLLMDIELSIDGSISSSDTVEIKVIKDVTYNA